jgi:hypothetical protein
MVIFHQDAETISPDAIPPTLNSLTNWGNTDLQKALEIAYKTLKDKGASHSFIVLITDGGIDLGDEAANTASEEEAQAVIKACAKDGIRIIPIQLFSSEADQSFLRNAANTTSGCYLTSKDDLASVLPAALHDLSIELKLSLSAGPFYAREKPVDFTVTLSETPLGSANAQVICTSADNDNSRYIADITDLSTINKLSIEFAYSGTFETAVRLETAYGVIEKRTAAKFLILEPTPEQEAQETAEPMETAPDIEQTQFQDTVTYIPYLNIAWRSHVINPQNLFYDADTQGVQYFIQTRALALDASLKHKNTQAPLTSNTLIEMPPGSILSYTGNKTSNSEFDIIRRSLIEPDRVIHVRASVSPAYWEFYILVSILVLVAALIGISIKLTRPPGVSVEMTLGSECLNYKVTKKITLWEALFRACDNLILGEFSNAEVYERVYQLLITHPAKEALSGIYMKPGKNGLIFKTKSGAVESRPNGYTVLNEGRVILTISKEGGVYV